MNRFGFDPRKWDSAKAESKHILAEAAKRRQMIPYSDFVRQIHSIHLDYDDSRLAHFLGEISEERKQRRPRYVDRAGRS